MTPTEDRLRAALEARADLVTPTDLQPQHLPAPASARPRWLVPLAAAAAVAALVAGGTTVVNLAADTDPAPATPPVNTTDPLPSPVPTPAPSLSSRPSPKPSNSTSPSTSPPPRVVATKQLQALGIKLTVPESWTVKVTSGGHVACVAPSHGAATCSGVTVRASGDWVDDGYKSEVCPGKRVTGPDRVALTQLRAWYSTYAQGCATRHTWWINGDFSLHVGTADLSRAQRDVVESARVITPPAQQPPSPKTKRLSVGLVSLVVPQSWQADQGGDTTCVGPASDPCDGVLVAAAGDVVTDPSDVGSVNCSAEPLTGPRREALDTEMTWYASFGCGWRHRWVLEKDPFWSLAVIAAKPDADQLRAIRSVRLAKPKSS
jgi:hypothetical protein